MEGPSALFSPNRLSSASSSDDFTLQASKTRAADGRGIGRGTRRLDTAMYYMNKNMCSAHFKGSLGFFRGLVPMAGWEIEPLSIVRVVAGVSPSHTANDSCHTWSTFC